MSHGNNGHDNLAGLLTLSKGRACSVNIDPLKHLEP